MHWPSSGKTLTSSDLIIALEPLEPYIPKADQSCRYIVTMDTTPILIRDLELAERDAKRKALERARKAKKQRLSPRKSVRSKRRKLGDLPSEKSGLPKRRKLGDRINQQSTPSNRRKFGDLSFQKSFVLKRKKLGEETKPRTKKEISTPQPKSLRFEA